MQEVALFGYDLFGEAVKPAASGPIAERFTVPPFSILDARSGEWRMRKSAWISLGIQSEVGRDAKAITGKSDYPGRYEYMPKMKTDTSVFDPLLCEIAYRWFCPDGGQIVDPFAGGSVRGIVAGALGYAYWGSDLRSEQIAANEQQADKIATAVRPVWICGDSMDTLESAPPADLVFSCPPYGDLERYSDDPRDLSAMDWHAFVGAYKRIVLRCAQKMKDNTFACFVVGDFRDGRGFYRNFVSTTIEAFEACGVRLYNEAILATPAGMAAMSITRQFRSGRKIAKTHQNVLVFCKGDWKAAAEKCEGHNAKLT